MTDGPAINQPETNTTLITTIPSIISDSNQPLPTQTKMSTTTTSTTARRLPQRVTPRWLDKDNFTQSKLKYFLTIMEIGFPIGTDEWASAVSFHSKNYPGRDFSSQAQI